MLENWLHVVARWQMNLLTTVWPAKPQKLAIIVAQKALTIVSRQLPVKKTLATVMLKK